MFIDTTEFASIYDPWVGDPFTPMFVILARMAGVASLFLCAGQGIVSMAARGELDFDPHKHSCDIRTDLRYGGVVTHRHGNRV